jgi:hypothetical protein
MRTTRISMEFFKDHTVRVTLAGEQLGPYVWSNLGDWGSLDDADINLNWDITARGHRGELQQRGRLLYLYLPQGRHSQVKPVVRAGACG